MRQRGSTIIKENMNGFNVKAFTLTPDDNWSTHIIIGNWFIPTKDQLYRSLIIEKIKREVARCIGNHVNKEIFKSKQHVIDIDIKHRSMIKNKKSFMGMEITLFHESNINFKDQNYVSSLNDLLNWIVFYTSHLKHIEFKN